MIIETDHLHPSAVYLFRPALFTPPLPVIFVGMMNLFYVVWDYVDERLFDKRNTSDCAQFSELLGWPTSCKSYPTALTQIFHPSASFKMERIYLPMWEQKGRARREGYY